AELVRRRMCIGRDERAVDGLEPGRAGDDDVLAELRGQLHALLVQLGLGADALRVDGLEHGLRVREELVVVRDRLGLAADRDHRSLGAVVGEAVPDLALGRLAPRALRRARHALLAQEDDGRVHVAVRLLQRLLAGHHPGAGAVAQLLDEACRDLRSHYCSTSSGASTCTPGSAALRASVSGPSSASGSVTTLVAGASTPLLAAGLNSLTAIFCLPCSIASAITRAMRPHERMASSLPGMT